MTALKCAVQDYYSLLTVPRTVSNMYAQVAWALSCANHVQNIERLCAARVAHGMKESSTIKFAIVQIAFISALFYWLNHDPMTVVQFDCWIP